MEYALATDLYQLNMMYVYFKDGMKDDISVFDVFFRVNPFNKGYGLMGCLNKVIELVKNIRFREEDIEYLRGLGFYDEEFLTYLKNFKFHGDIYAAVDGTPVFAYECSHCGARYNNTDPYHDETVDSIEEVRERNGKLLDIITKRVMVCGKNENYIEYYAPSCGYVHGQVVSAYIKFKGRNAQYNSSIPAINTSKGLAMQSISTRAMMMPFESIDFDEERIERSLDAIKDYEEPASDDTEESLPDTSESVNEKEDEA